jgi:hypothetical protein
MRLTRGFFLDGREDLLLLLARKWKLSLFLLAKKTARKRKMSERQGSRLNFCFKQRKLSQEPSRIDAALGGVF